MHDNKRKAIKILPIFTTDSKSFDEVEEDNSSLVQHMSTDISDLRLPSILETRLFDHQKVGIAWLLHIHRCHPGGILGDGA